MNTVRILLANSDRRSNNLIEVALRDVCFEQAHVDCYTTTRLDEVLHRGCLGEFQLIILSPDNLVTGPPQRAARCTMDEAVAAIRTLKIRCPVPVIAVGVRPLSELAMLEAGADAVFGILFDRDKLRAELRRVLHMPEPVQAQPEANRWSFGAGLFRSFQKLRQS